MNTVLKTLLILLIVSFAKSGSAQPLLEENFNYTAGDSLGAHGWTSFSGGATNVLSVVSPGLTYPGYTLSGIGNAAKVNNNGQDAYKPLTSDVTTGAVYTSFMMKLEASNTAGAYFLALLPSTSTTLYTGRVFAKKDASGTNYALGVSKSTETVNYTPFDYVVGTTYLVVLKYEFVTGATNDLISLYVFNAPNAPATEPTTATIPPFSATAGDLTNLGRVALRQSVATDAPTLIVDGIRVSTQWNSIITSVQPMSNTVADGFKLEQNYPNPFNPTTNIRFSLPSNGFTSVKVYDMMGKEVSTLVNGIMTSGTYTVDFNGINLTSGTYFYKINFTGINGSNYTDTKKLMLVK